MFEPLVMAHHVETTRRVPTGPTANGQSQQALLLCKVFKLTCISQEGNFEAIRYRNLLSEVTYQERKVRPADLLDQWMKDYKVDPVKVLQAAGCNKTAAQQSILGYSEFCAEA